jgi:hypothetical protein
MYTGFCPLFLPLPLPLLLFSRHCELSALILTGAWRLAPSGYGWNVVGIIKPPPGLSLP